MPELNTARLENTSQKSSKIQNQSFLSLKTITLIFLFANIFSALFNGLNDCDETYNYWEPLHHLLFPSKTSFKTWEYDSKYALRSWFYLFLHSLPIYIHSHWLKVGHAVLFQFLRVGLAACTAMSQAFCFKNINNKFGPNISKLFFFFSAFSAGTFISSTAFIPSSFCMILSYCFLGCWLKNNTVNAAVYCIAFGTLVGWPFFGAVGIPVALDIIFRRRNNVSGNGGILKLIYWGVESLLYIMPGALMMDVYFYKRLTFSSLNIVMYNIFSNKGPDLYGVEPLSYYLKNLFLNFNFIMVLAIFSLPITFMVEQYFQHRIGKKYYQTTTWMFTLHLSPLYIWMAIFFSQPHKEERFLFPIYPFICFAAAVCVSSIQKIYKLLTNEKKVFGSVSFPDHGWIQKITITITTLFSISRILALIFGFVGVLNLYSNTVRQIGDQLSTENQAENQTSASYNLCLGKEWHRFGTHFLIPDIFDVHFIRSEFRGQLPGKFLGSWPLSTSYDIISKKPKLLRQKFNDDNSEEIDRYLGLSECDFIIDREGDYVPTTKLEPRFSKTDEWEIVSKHKMINLENSPSWAKSFYIPYVFEEKNIFDDYVLLVRKEETGAW